VIEIARIETQLRAGSDQGDVCSVLWLIGKDAAGLAEVFGLLGATLGPVSCRAVLSTRLKANQPRPLSDGFGSSVLEARLEYSGAMAEADAAEAKNPFASRDEGAICEVVDVDATQSAFWSLFTDEAHGSGLVAALSLAPGALQGRWLDAAVQLSVAQGFLPWLMPGSNLVEEVLLRAFLRRVLSDGGIAVTLAGAEMYDVGVALTGSAEAIDRIEEQLAHLPRLPDADVRYSLEIGDAWT
jgi:hypothetical protein